MKITARGWPWQEAEDWLAQVEGQGGQRYGWNPFSVKGMGRFGGGWAFKFGIAVSRDGRDIVLDLIIGSIRIQFKKEKQA